MCLFDMYVYIYLFIYVYVYVYVYFSSEANTLNRLYVNFKTRRWSSKRRPTLYGRFRIVFANLRYLLP